VGGDRGCDNVDDLESHEVVKQIKVCENTRRDDNDACSGWAFTHPWGPNASSAQ
jgi:hypothetical protein